MLNRIVITEKNQIVTLKVVDELRQVDVKPALHALENNSALNNSQKVSLDLNNLQVISPVSYTHLTLPTTPYV